MGRVVGSKRYFSKSDFKSGANRGGKPQGSCKQKIIQKITNRRLCKSYQQKTMNNLFPWSYTSVAFCIIIALDVINIVFGLKIFNPLCFLSQFLPHEPFLIAFNVSWPWCHQKLYLQYFQLLLITRGQVWTSITQTDLLSKLVRNRRGQMTLAVILTLTIRWQWQWPWQQWWQ